MVFSDTDFTGGEISITLVEIQIPLAANCVRMKLDLREGKPVH